MEYIMVYCTTLMYMILDCSIIYYTVFFDVICGVLVSVVGTESAASRAIWVKVQGKL